MPTYIIPCNIILVINTAVNIESIIPIINVCAKPFTVPVPSQNNTAAAINVVILPSIIAGNALEKPLCTATLKECHAINSSFILSNITTFASTAIPTESTIPAIPGNVNVICSKLNAANSSPT